MDVDGLGELLDHLPADVVGQYPGTGPVQDGLQPGQELSWPDHNGLGLVERDVKQH